VAAALVALWRAAGYPWSRRLHAMVRLWLEALTRRHTLDQSEQAALLAMSSRTMDRILRPHRGALRRRLYGRTKPGSLLKHQIPISQRALERERARLVRNRHDDALRRLERR
jgi:hypothetical protein